MNRACAEAAGAEGMNSLAQGFATPSGYPRYVGGTEKMPDSRPGCRSVVPAWGRPRGRYGVCALSEGIHSLGPTDDLGSPNSSGYPTNPTVRFSRADSTALSTICWPIRDRRGDSGPVTSSPVSIQ
jgi:hypothetical protein